MAGSVSVAGGNPVTLALAKAPMSRQQVGVVGLSVALNALDGFDVLAITFAAPGITKDWGIGPAQLGIALSSGLAGMSLGSLALAPLGDRFGRRPLVLVSLILMAAGMLLTATATGLLSLCFWRVITGIGIGGMVAAINAVASEFSNERRRDLSVALMTVGLPLGGLIGGFATAELAVTHGWQAIFVAGGVITAAFIPIVWFGLPESLEYLVRQGTPAARQRIDDILARMGHPPLAADVVLAAAPVSRGSFAELFGPRFRTVTLLLVAAYFLHMTTFYFFSGWLPKLLTDLGYTTPDAIRTSAMMSLGGVVGGAALGWAAPRLGLTRLVVVAMIGTTVTFVVFGQVAGLPALQAVAFLAGVCVFGGIVGLYALLARSFPTELRVTGTGLAIGIGRGGAVLGPVIGGFLIAAGTSIALAIAIVGAGALVAAVLLMALRRVQAVPG
ncbi:MFS transporter [Glacieibacterium frigidum]|uniref:MFS transporter n=1 Tax=Glacieibacterium frigidum TaxID=2593303 RepID=A0A552UF13_9SPHN|nr:MFS transporter [Glacieibacterium frigidum]TRW16812.1 MFS transporter [Glacieibacterium frigidum]